MSRDRWTALTDELLLAECEVDTYRASGPGGQKRNKTSSAVRIRHAASGLLVIAEESRSQHENKAKALKRLRQAFALELREPLAPEALTPEALQSHPAWPALHPAAGRQQLGPKHEQFWPLVALILDLLQAQQARVSEVAELLGISTGNLIDLLQIDPKVWQTANQLRAHFGQKPLKS